MKTSKYSEIKSVYFENTTTRNAFYKIIIEQSNISKRYRIVVKWGPIGEKGNSKVIQGSIGNLSAAKNQLFDLKLQRTKKGYVEKTEATTPVKNSSKISKRSIKKAKITGGSSLKRFSFILDEV